MKIPHTGTKKSSQKIYNELSERIEQTSKSFYSIFIKWSAPVTMIPPLITSLMNFYFLHLGADESFQLPFPTVYS